MPNRAKPETKRGASALRGDRIRECGYFVPEEIEALAKAARAKRCSKSEILRRALRQYLDLRL